MQQYQALFTRVVWQWPNGRSELAGHPVYYAKNEREAILKAQEHAKAKRYNLVSVTKISGAIEEEMIWPPDPEIDVPEIIA